MLLVAESGRNFFLWISCWSKSSTEGVQTKTKARLEPSRE